VEHLSDDVLFAYALDPILVPDREAIKEHLSSCNDCRQELAEIAFDLKLANPEAWPDKRDDDDELPLIARESAREDAEAETLLNDLLEGPPEAFVWANLPEKPKYYTGGVVRDRKSTRLNSSHP